MTEVTAWYTRLQVSVQNATAAQQRHLAQSRTGLCKQCPIRISGRRPLQSEAGSSVSDEGLPHIRTAINRCSGDS